MRIIAICSFYDEVPSWLSALVASVARFADHLVMVDGAYALYPGGKPSSGVSQHQALIDTAAATGIGLTLHVPRAKWMENEVGKRTFLFQLASVEAEEGDWFFVIDSDELVIEHSPDIKATLGEHPDFLVGDVTLQESKDYLALGVPPEFALHLHTVEPTKVPRFFRAIDNMQVIGNHYTYVGDYQGERDILLWGHSKEPRLDCSAVVLEHRNAQRVRTRADAAKAYYQMRDSKGAESRPVYMEGTDGEIIEVPLKT